MQMNLLWYPSDAQTGGTLTQVNTGQSPVIMQSAIRNQLQLAFVGTSNLYNKVDRLTTTRYIILNIFH